MTPATATAGAPRRRLSRAERERKILDAAVAVFTERGFHAASMDAVAQRVGVTKPVLYDHFGSKEGLLQGCVARARAELLAATSAAATSTDGPEGMLRRGVLGFFTFLDERAPAWTLLYEETALAAEAVEGFRGQQIEFFAGLLAAQAPGRDRRRLEGWAQVIVGACERLALWRGPGGQVDRNDGDRVSAELATEYLMDLVWAGLAAQRRDGAPESAG